MWFDSESAGSRLEVFRYDTALQFDFNALFRYSRSIASNRKHTLITKKRKGSNPFRFLALFTAKDCQYFASTPPSDFHIPSKIFGRLRLCIHSHILCPKKGLYATLSNCRTRRKICCLPCSFHCSYCIVYRALA